MTAKNDTPGTGQESTGYELGTYPLEEASDELVALAVEDLQEEMDAAFEDIIEALDGDATLTDQKILRATEAGESLQALMTTLTLRVPPEERIEKGQD